MSSEGISPEDAALVARETKNKAADSRIHDGIEFATVVSYSFDEGLVPMVGVQLSSDDPGNTRIIPCLTGSIPGVGERVAIIRDNPAGCYAIGQVGITAGAAGRISLACDTGS